MVLVRPESEAELCWPLLASRQRSLNSSVRNRSHSTLCAFGDRYIDILYFEVLLYSMRRIDEVCLTLDLREGTTTHAQMSSLSS